MESVTKEMMLSYQKNKTTCVERGITLPNKNEIIQTLKEIRKLFFPAFFAGEEVCGDLEGFAKATLNSIYYKIKKQIHFAYLFNEIGQEKMHSEILAKEFIKQLPNLRNTLFNDLRAAFDGDPAAKNKEEIIFCYPGFYAIFVYRIAHLLSEMGVPFIPRLMAEYAHEKTGIDIHPGAKIGECFFIDHGTGVVIGETAEIGKNVKIYQNVTLGALSLRKGQGLSGIKRHPTLKDSVTVYSGATILGGKTVIGDGAVIGGNSFLTESVGAGMKVTAKLPELIFIESGNMEKN